MAAGSQVQSVGYAAELNTERATSHAVGDSAAAETIREGHGKARSDDQNISPGHYLHGHRCRNGAPGSLSAYPRWFGIYAGPPIPSKLREYARSGSHTSGERITNVAEQYQ